MKVEKPEKYNHRSLVVGIYNKLFDEFGKQNWWPAETPFEVVVGALLTQQTKWQNVEEAIKNLKQRGLMDAESIASSDIELLEETIYCTGFYRQKAKRLKQISTFFSENKMEEVFSLPLDELRNTLLSLNGVGPETADSIILYAANRQKFVIDVYTKRIMKCLGIEGNYSQLQELFEKNLPDDVDVYKEYHALIVEYAKKYCVKKKCDICPLTGEFNGPDYL
ncbi:endonuclease [Methanohalophilus sp.]|uniref:endonuclease III domain-containing protein n=1 Tax=Methanohalophilus sp. TaxID=1966352 RepID=UPI002615B012|nr:endonuclease [Methanohalophilus sp.]MDK2892982.1 endonuclease related protein [Methanohalophilus sp.]